MDKTKKTQHGAAKKRKAAHRVFALLISALVVIGIAFAAVLIIKRKIIYGDADGGVRSVVAIAVVARIFVARRSGKR